MKHGGVRCSSIPAAKHIDEFHAESTDGETVLCHCPFLTMSHLSVSGGGTAIDVGAIDCASSILEKREELGVFLDLIVSVEGW